MKPAPDFTPTPWETNRANSSYAPHVSKPTLMKPPAPAPKPKADERDVIVFIMLAILSTLDAAAWVWRKFWEHPIGTICGIVGGVMLVWVLKR